MVEVMVSENMLYRRDLERICHEKLPFEKLYHKSILVTGGTGLIGTCLVDMLLILNEKMNLQMNIQVLCRNKAKTQKYDEAYSSRKDLKIIYGDICSLPGSDYEWDYVIHGAGNSHPAAFAQEPVETMKTAFMGTMNLLEKCISHRCSTVQRFLVLSTGEIYGDQMQYNEQGCSEREPGMVQTMNPRACYPEGKRAAETLCAAYYSEYGVDTVVARLSYIYGPTMQPESSKADIQFINKALAHETIVMKSAGMQYRSYTYLSDAVIGIFYLLLKGSAGEAYNIANDQSRCTIREFAEKLAAAAGVGIEFESPSDIERAGYSAMQREILDASKLTALGYRAAILLEEGLKMTLEILQRNPGWKIP